MIHQLVTTQSTRILELETCNTDFFLTAIFGKSMFENLFSIEKKGGTPIPFSQNKRIKAYYVIFFFEVNNYNFAITREGVVLHQNYKNIY